MSIKNRPIPEIFDKEEIGKFIDVIRTSDKYGACGKMKNSEYGQDWIKFFKMRDICMICVCYGLALRPRSVCTLKINDIDFQHALIKIRHHNIKTKKPLILPVPRSVLLILKEYLQLPRLRFWRGSDYLFPSFCNDHISSERFKTVFRENVLKPLNIWKAPTTSKIPPYRLYTLRHSRATHLMDKMYEEKGTVDLLKIKEFLGHSDIRNTLVYVHTSKAFQESLRKTVDF